MLCIFSIPYSYFSALYYSFLNLKSFQNDLIIPRNYQSVLMHENGTRKMTPKHKTIDLYTNGNLADGEETSSDR